MVCVGGGFLDISKSDSSFTKYQCSRPTSTTYDCSVLAAQFCGCGALNIDIRIRPPEHVTVPTAIKPVREETMGRRVTNATFKAAEERGYPEIFEIEPLRIVYGCLKTSLNGAK